MPPPSLPINTASIHSHTLRSASPSPSPSQLSISSDQQWTSLGKSVPRSGFALSRSNSSSSNAVTQRGFALASPASASAALDNSNGGSTSRSSGVGQAYDVTDRKAPRMRSASAKQLNAAAIFEKLGLNPPTSAGSASTSSGQSSTSDPSNGSHRLDPAGSGGTTSRQPARADSSTFAPSTTNVSEVANLPDFDDMHARYEDTRSTPQPDQAGGPRAPLQPPSSVQSMVPIDADILLPFADRPAEVKELLEQQPKNKGLFDLLKEAFTPKRATALSPDASMTASPLGSPASTPGRAPSPTKESDAPQHSNALQSFRERDRHSRHDSLDSVTTVSPAPALTSLTAGASAASSARWSFDDLQKHLAAPRSQFCDQEWIDVLKAHVYPRSQLLWERLRACLGVDVDDEQGEDKFEPLSSDIYPDEAGSDQAQYSASQASSFLPANPEVDLKPASLPDSALSPRALLQNYPSLQTATQEMPNPFSPRPTSGVASSISPATGRRSPALPAISNASQSASASQGASSDANGPNPANKSPARMHRRTSSGGSSFRRSFTMSSIHEDEPVEHFDDDCTGSNSASGAATPDVERDLPFGKLVTNVNPSNAAQSAIEKSPLDPTQTQIAGARPIYGSEANKARTPGHSSHSSLEQYSIGQHPQAPGLSVQTNPLGTSPGSTGFGTSAPGHLPPPYALTSPTLHSPAFGSSSLPPGSALPPHAPSDGAALSSSLGLSLPSPAARVTSNIGSAGLAGQAARNPNRRSRDFYDDYTSVFGSEDEQSVSGSVRSRGHGPGMRFSFGSSDAQSPLSPIGRPGGGFALAGINPNKKSANGSNSGAQSSVSGRSTPKAE